MLDLTDPPASLFQREGLAAMLGRITPLAHYPPDEWEQVFALNVHANWRLIRALDPLLRVRMRRELLAMQRRFAVPMLVITHDPEDVEALAENVVILQDGRVVRTVRLRDAGLRQGDQASRHETIRSLLMG